ncbi:MAG TPA: SPFH domain-containing protein [Acidimicrobiales bacterium]|nr:SPFH domain-containing protein [Acidimicrobiales bacterium]
MIASSGAVVGIVVAAIVVLVLLVLSRSVRVVQQGQVGVVKRVGRFHRLHDPGVVIVVPFIDTLTRVDMREEPRVGDMQSVITKDNVSVLVNATIFSQVVDVRLALFEVSNYHVAVDQLARTALRAVFGGMTLDEALSERERINAELQLHMASATEKWGVRLNRIEIVDIVPPDNILNAMAMQKEADQQKRAAILTSEGQQQAAINTAQGEKQANVLRAEGAKQSAILSAEGEKQATVLKAEGFKEAQIRSGQGQAGYVGALYAAIHEGKPTPELLAVLQLDALQKIATSDNAKLVVPVETAGLLGAAQTLKSLLSEVSVSESSGNGSAP